ncbi:MAG: NAD(P)-binding domain-containing protein, partial [Alphaproteobacteria bacterium]|nr:NAD(P)-binding domain-containing protein [Alphaproteobacteria bacterium]
MKISIIGTGYVGLPTGIGLAELGHDVICIDQDTAKINALKHGQTTLYEEGLADLLDKHRQTGKIQFTSSMKDGILGADVVFLAVGTPPHPVTKEADLQYIFAA